MLPFTGLRYPNGVAVDPKGDIYVADRENHRVLKLSAGSTTQTVLPFPPSAPESDWSRIPAKADGLRLPAAVALDKAGNLFVTDCYSPGRVWELPAGSNTPMVLLTGFGLDGLAVDTAGNLYGNALGPARVWKLAAPITPNATPTMLPVTGLQWPIGVAVDSEGDLYVVDAPAAKPVANHRVVKISPDLTTQTVLPISDLKFPFGVAVDGPGTVYITDGVVPEYYKPANPGVISRVLKLSAGSSVPTVLPFTGLNGASFMAVRPIWMAGPPDTIYVSDTENNRVLGLGLG